MSETKKKAKQTEKPKATDYEVIMSDMIRDVLSTIQTYSSGLHACLLQRAMESLAAKAIFNGNLLGITTEEEEKGMQALKLNPVLATQAMLNYGFNFARYSRSELRWNLAMCVVILSS